MPSSTQTDEFAHIFNNDLLLGSDDRQGIRDVYPELFHVLDFPELRAEFVKYEEPANRSKRWSRTAGYAAIYCGTFALVASILSQFYLHSSSLLSVWIVSIAAGLGILSLILGSQVLHGNAKRNWLRDRLITERMRQLHFQAFPFRLASMLKSLDSTDDQAAYQKERGLWLKEFLVKFKGKEGVELSNIIDDERLDEGWLFDGPPQMPLPDMNQPGLTRLFDAYKILRFDHQVQYATLKLEGDGRNDSEVKRAAFYSFCSILAICAVFALHMLILAVMVVKFRWMQLPFGNDAPDALVHASEFLTVVVAVLILALRAFEEGLQPGREVERYRSYRAAMRSAREHFDRAETVSEKIDAMKKAENAAFEEMCGFLKTQNDARFRI